MKGLVVPFSADFLLFISFHSRTVYVSFVVRIDNLLNTKGLNVMYDVTEALSRLTSWSFCAGMYAWEVDTEGSWKVTDCHSKLARWSRPEDEDGGIFAYFQLLMHEIGTKTRNMIKQQKANTRLIYNGEPGHYTQNGKQFNYHISPREPLLIANSFRQLLKTR